MADPTYGPGALIVTGGYPGADTVTGFRKDGSFGPKFGTLNHGRYAHSCGSFISSVGDPVS